MPQVEPVRHKSGRRSVVIATTAVVVMIAVIVGVLVLVSRPKVPKQETKVVLNDAREKAFVGKNSEAIELLEKQLGQAKNKDEKLALYMRLGATQEEKGDNKAALEAYKQANAIDSGFGTTHSVARVAEAAGDKALSLKYYERCRDLIKDGKAGPNGDFLPSIEAAITRLGEKS